MYIFFCVSQGRHRSSLHAQNIWMTSRHVSKTYELTLPSALYFKNRLIKIPAVFPLSSMTWFASWLPTESYTAKLSMNVTSGPRLKSSLTLKNTMTSFSDLLTHTYNTLRPFCWAQYIINSITKLPQQQSVQIKLALPFFLLVK